jgi:hypothetical protein
MGWFSGNGDDDTTQGTFPADLTGIPNSDGRGQNFALAAALANAGAAIGNADRPGRYGRASTGSLLSAGASGFADGLGMQAMLRQKAAIDEAKKKMAEMQMRGMQQEQQGWDQVNKAQQEGGQLEKLALLPGPVGAAVRQIMQQRQEEAYRQQRLGLDRDANARGWAEHNKPHYDSTRGGFVNAKDNTFRPLTGPDGQPLGAGPPDLSDVSGLGKRFVAETGSFRELSSQATRMTEGLLSDNAAGDTALIFSFMKMLDPTSVVKEGEQATVENSRGIPETVSNLYNKALAGTRLTEPQREEIVNYGRSIWEGALQQHETAKQYFTNLANQYKIPVDQIIQDYTTVPQVSWKKYDERKKGTLKNAHSSGQVKDTMYHFTETGSRR